MTRRTLMIGGAVMALSGRARAGNALAAALDAAATEPSPARGLDLLRGFDVTTLAPGAALDLLTARSGLAADVALAQAGDRPTFDLRLARLFGPHPGVARIERHLMREQARVSRAALRLFAAIGIGARTPGEGYSRLWQSTDGDYPDSEVGRDAAVAAMNASLATMRPLVPTLIGPVPAYCRDVSASRGTSEEQAAGKVGVRRLPMPGRPGSYVVDLARISQRPTWTLPSVVAHELLPGHMIQLPLEAAARPHKLRIAYAAGFAEGWSIHAERLVARSGLWSADPRAMLGYLHWRLFRIARARVDIGINRGRWSLEQARDRLIEWQGEPAYFAPFESDLTRIQAEPATRVAEMMFALAIEDGASGKAGASLVRYHQSLLLDGRMRGDEIARRSRRA